MKFKMILVFISLIVILKCSEAVNLLSIHHITITKINVDALELIENGFEEINHAQHINLCIILKYRPWFIFKPLPMDHKSLVLLLSTIEEIKSREDVSNFLRYISNTWQQDPSNLRPLQDLPRSSESQEFTSKKENTELENIYVGTARKEVSAIPCKFGDFTIYLVAAKAVNFLLFLKENRRSPIEPLGFITKFLGLQRARNSLSQTIEKFIELFSEQMASTKENRIIFPMGDNTNEMEINKLQNLRVCVGLFYYHFSGHVNKLGSASEVEIINEEEIDEKKVRNEIAELSYENSEFYDVINCNILKADQKIYSFAIVEHPIENKIYVWQGSQLKLDEIDVYTYTP